MKNKNTKKIETNQDKNLEEEYRVLVQTSPDCIKLFDLKGKIIFINKGGLKEHRLKNIEEAKKWSYLNGIIKEDQGRFKKAMSDAKKGLTTTIEIRHTHKGSTRDVCMETITPVKDKDGKIYAIFGVSRDISEQKKSSELRYRQLFESSIDAIMTIKPPTWAFTLGNPATIKLFGIKDNKQLESLTPDKLSPKYQPDGQLSSVKARKMIGIAMKHGINTFEWTHKKHNGPEFYATVTLVRMTVDGEIFLQATVRDITKYKQAEEGMSLGNEIIKNMEEGVYLVGLDDVLIKYTNPKFEKMFGYKPGEMIGKHASIVNAPGDKNPKDTANEIMKVIRKTGGWHGEVYNIKKDKTSFWCYANVSTFNHSKYGRVLIATHTDITERKQSEEHLIHSSQQRKLILSSAKEGILGLDLEGKHIFINPAAAEMFGHKVKDLIGKPSHSIWHHTRSDGTPYPREECPIYAAFHDGEIHRVSDEVFWRKDGTSFPVEYTSTPIYEKDRLAGAVVTFANITERKQAEELLGEKIADLEKMNSLMVGRELKMIELKEKIKDLSMGKKAGSEKEKWKEKFRGASGFEEDLTLELKNIYIGKIKKSNISRGNKKKALRDLEHLIYESKKHDKLLLALIARENAKR
jgi:PAS domain S-box-containing protein